MWPNPSYLVLRIYQIEMITILILDEAGILAMNGKWGIWFRFAGKIIPNEEFLFTIIDKLRNWPQNDDTNISN